MLIGLIKDESGRFDGYNWHDEYAEHFKQLGANIGFLDFKLSDWGEQVRKLNPDALMWRAWHRPDDRDDAKDKISYLGNIEGRLIFPTTNMYWSYDDKVRQLFLMEHFNIPHPTTFFSRSVEEISYWLDRASYPIVSKAKDGACGDNVRRFYDRNSIGEHIRQIFSEEGLPTRFPWVRQRGYVYLQEFLPISRDLRIITIGDSIGVSYWRESEDWIHNVGKGGRINPEGIPKKAEDLAIEYAKKMGFHWCAFDMTEIDGKILVFEFSAIFGFSKSGGYHKVFGNRNANILKKQAEYIIEYLKKR